MNEKSELHAIAQQIRAITENDPYRGKEHDEDGLRRGRLGDPKARHAGLLLVEAIKHGAFGDVAHLQVRDVVGQLAEKKRYRLAFRAVADLLADEWVKRDRAFDVVGEAIMDEAQRLGGADRPAANGNSAKEILTDGERSLWDVLRGRTDTAKKLAKELDTSERVIHKWKRGLCEKGYQVNNQRGRGYYRPDAPPDDLAAG